MSLTPLSCPWMTMPIPQSFSLDTTTNNNNNNTEVKLLLTADQLVVSNVELFPLSSLCMTLSLRVCK